MPLHRLTFHPTECRRQAWRWLLEQSPAHHETFTPLLDHLSEARPVTLSEIFDGDHLYRPVGCFAQVASVAEVLRVYDTHLRDQAVPVVWIFETIVLKM